MNSLHHEHLVRINDPTNLTGEWLTREQLWDGLHHTVLAPRSIDPSIDSARVQELVPNELRREITRGSATTIDRVELARYHSLTIHADDTSMFAGSSLSIRIEEPAPGMLFVRFTYELTGLAADRSDDEDAARCHAYQQSDVERVRQARRFAARERLQ